MDESPREGFPAIPGVVIEGRIARGRHGTIYAATRESDGARIAVKHHDRQEPRSVPSPHLLLGLCHPNLVRVLELRGAGSDCEAMELVKGISLRELLLNVAAADEDLSPPMAAEIARQVALGLAALHAHKGAESPLVHGDVSPSNVLVDYDGVVRVADFGSLATEATTQRFGTPGYIPPEVLRSSRAVQLSDLFALGSLVFEMLAGVPPRFDDAPEHTFPDIQDFRDDVPPELEELLYELLAAEPRARPTAAAVADRLSDIAGACRPRPDVRAYMSSFFGQVDAAPLWNPAQLAPRGPIGFHISGAAVKATFEFLVRSHGAKGYELVRARLSPRTQAVLQRHVDSSAWFDASVVVELTQLAEFIFGVGQTGDVARAIGAASAEYAMSDNGPFRVFRERGLREGIPAFLRSTEDIYGLYYDRGRWCIEAVSPGSALCRHICGADFPPPIVDRIYAYLIRGLELVGACDVSLDRVRNGKDWVVHLSWTTSED